MDHLGVNSLRLSKCHKYFENHFKVDFESVSSVKENLENGQVNNSPNPFLKYFPTLYYEDTYFGNWFKNISEKDFSTVISKVGGGGKSVIESLTSSS